jgi:hypothetical protein
MDFSFSQKLKHKPLQKAENGNSGVGWASKITAKHVLMELSSAD